MEYTEYKFDRMRYKKSDYIFQRIEGRKLSDVYHSHDFYEWIVIYEGEVVQIVNDKTYNMKKNSYMVLCPGDKHKFVSQTDDIKICFLSVREREIKTVADLFGMDLTSLSFFCSEMDLKQKRLLYDFFLSSYEGEYKLLLSTLIKIYTDNSAKIVNIPESLKYAAKEMLKNENLCIGIKRFSELSGYSISHLRRLMKKYYNLTPHEYIKNARLESAYNMLISTQVCIEEISECLGYESVSHFNKIFSEKYGITPAKARKY